MASSRCVVRVVLLLGLLIGAMTLSDSASAAPSLTSSTSGPLTLEIDGTQQITLSLEARPSADVTVTLAVTDPSVAGLSSGSGEPSSRLQFTFPTASWQASQVYTITALGPGETMIARQVSGGGGPPTYSVQRVEVSAPRGRLTAADDCTADTTTSCSIAAPSGATRYTVATGEIESLDGVDWTVQSYGDIDWFGVNFGKGGKYVLQILGSANGDANTLRSPAMLGVYDSSGDPVPGMLRRDSQAEDAFAFEAQAAGQHYIAVSHYHHDPSNPYAKIEDKVGTYTLRIALPPATDDCVSSVTTSCTATLGSPFSGDIQWKRIGDWGKYGEGHFRQDEDWIKVELTKGKVYRLDLEGKVGDDVSRGTLSNPDLADRYYTIGSDNRTKQVSVRFVTHDIKADGGARTWNDTALFKATDTGVYYFAVRHQSGANLASLRKEFQGDSLTGTYTFTVTEILNHVDNCGEDVSSTCTVTVGGSGTQGTIELHGDIDWYSVQLQAGKDYLITQTHRWSGNRLTLGHSDIVRVYNAAGESQIEGFYYPYEHSWLTFSPTVNGKYFIGAGARFSSGGTGTYEVAVKELTGDDIAGDSTTTSNLAAGGSASGTIGTTQDIDWHRATLTAGTEYVFEIEPHYGGNDRVCEDGADAVRELNFYGEYHCLFGRAEVASIILYALYDGNGAAVVAPQASVRERYRIVYTPNATGPHFIATSGRWPRYAGPYTVTLKASVHAPEDHPADVTTTATVSSIRPLQGKIDYIQDVDWVKVSMKAGIGYVFKARVLADEQDSRRHRVVSDPRVFNGVGERLSRTRLASTLPSWYSLFYYDYCHEVDADGEFYVQVEGRYFGVGPYELTVRERVGGCD